MHKERRVYMDKLTKKGLDGTQLKTIALALMVLDHIRYFF